MVIHRQDSSIQLSANATQMKPDKNFLIITNLLTIIKKDLGLLAMLANFIVPIVAFKCQDKERVVS